MKEELSLIQTVLRGITTFSICIGVINLIPISSAAKHLNRCIQYELTKLDRSKSKPAHRIAFRNCTKL